MGIPENAGRVLIAGFPAGPPPPVLVQLAQTGCLGGFILFRRNVPSCEQVAELNRQLIGAFPAGAPPLIAVDQEGGRVKRVGAPALQLPPMRRFGELDDPALSERVAHAVGLQLRALGFNLDMIPVLDIDSNPDNPVIGDRSFGSTPELVVRHGRAFAHGLQASGMAACGKHFPGHGDTQTDSHLSLPRLSQSRAQLEARELVPFRSLAGELACMMSAHVVFEDLTGSRPATLAATAMTDLLRGDLGFRGLAVSDDMEMKAITAQYGAGEAACLAVDAGCDALLICSEVGRTQASHRALVERAEADPRFAARLAEAAGRVTRAATRYRASVLPDGALQEALGAPEVMAAAKELSERFP